jgi:hypothetical protein
MKCGRPSISPADTSCVQQRQSDAAKPRVAHAARITAAHRIAHAYGNRHRQPQRDHEEQRGNIDRHLMAGNHVLAQRADDQRRRHEQPSLGQQVIAIGKPMCISAAMRRRCGHSK